MPEVTRSTTTRTVTEEVEVYTVTLTAQEVASFKNECDALNVDYGDPTLYTIRLALINTPAKPQGPLCLTYPVEPKGPLRAGDRVRVVEDDEENDPGEFVGRVGVLVYDPDRSDDLPYCVKFGAGTGRHGDPVNGKWYCAKVERA